MEKRHNDAQLPVEDARGCNVKRVDVYSDDGEQIGK
jgi:hypothetical protein